LADSRKPTAGKAVAPALAARLHKLGIRGDGDLILHLPLRYEDETRITLIRDAVPGAVAQFEVAVLRSEIAYRPRRQLVCHVGDESGELALRFLNFYPSQQKVLQVGARLRVFGEVRGGFFGTELIHPRFHVLREAEPLPEALTPVYPTTAGLGQTTLRRLIEAALGRTDLSDTLPEELRHDLDLAAFADAVKTLHHPPPLQQVADMEVHTRPAWQRMRFDELLAQQISLRRAYAARRQRGAPQLKALGHLVGRLLDSLPFRLTDAQRRVWCDISADLAATHPMQRLLQGDVGSGKTIVAALAMLQAAENGYQSALMAPTEILAEQHYRKLAGWLEPMGMQVAWLSGSLRKKLRDEMTQRIASGESLVVVGTHALIEESVEFACLGLSIVDEQHRFGVRQRLALKQKGDALRGQRSTPHQLTMSATPIPRTLAMSYYADLDVSAIDELPPGRQPVLTKLAAESRRDEVISRVREACRLGRQAYWVCPLIEESEALQLKTAEETFAHLTADLPDLRIGLVHGRLKPDAKAQVMQAFVSGAVQVLVATTVIEVGVDVPNASLMVIEHAERFGLSQLHQLRGRVGRGSAESACILIYAQPLGELARQRLKIIYEHQDGFEIARQDLALRGPGEFIGARQSGMPLLRYADLDDDAMVDKARAAAEKMLQCWPQAAERHLQRWLSGAHELLKA
jgi:ATP-dependent DNA helicase RecG